MSKPLLEFRARLAAVLSRYHEGLLVAFSGGVDSSCLLAEATAVLGDGRVVACLDRSPSLPRRELESARRVAASLGVRLLEVEPDAMGREAYRANGPDRCFHCKSALFEHMEGIAAAHGLKHLAFGAHRDDLGDHRPGHRAAEEHGVHAPLLLAGLGKAEVRALAKDRGLEVADKPSAPCLASRLPYGSEVSPEKLAQVERAESVLWAEGFSDCRVRHHGDIARIEVPVSEIGRLLDANVRERVMTGVREAGFRFVTVDLAGLKAYPQAASNAVQTGTPPVSMLPAP